MSADRCEPVYDDEGNLIAHALVGEGFDDEARGHLLDVIEAAKRVHAERVAADPSIVERYEAGQRRVRERVARLRGESS